MSATRYYQVLNALIDTPAALAPTRCWSSVCDACGQAGSGSGRHVGWVSRSERTERHSTAGWPGSRRAGINVSGSPAWRVAVLGVVVLVVAIFALREPNGHVSSAARRPRPRAPNTTSVEHRRRRAAAHRPAPPRNTGSASARSVRHGHPSGAGRAEVGAAGRPEQHDGPRSRASRRPTQFRGRRLDGHAASATSATRSCRPAPTTTRPIRRRKAAAQALQPQFPAIKRSKPKFAELPAGPVVVVLTPDYSAG